MIKAFLYRHLVKIVEWLTRKYDFIAYVDDPDSDVIKIRYYYACEEFSPEHTPRYALMVDKRKFAPDWDAISIGKTCTEISGKKYYWSRQ